MTSRRSRQAKIVRILGRGPVASHEALRALLAEEGVEATQATISRDLREIGAVKGAAGYTMVSSMIGGGGLGAGGHGGSVPALNGGHGRGVDGGAGMHHALGGAGGHGGHGGLTLGEHALSAVGRSVAMRTFVVSVERGGAMVVVRTGPGHASLVAAEIDRDAPAGVLGTVAGDDTIFVACRGEPAARRVAAEFAQAAGVAAARAPAKERSKAARGGR